MPSEASVKFFDETFFQKSFDLALDLSGRQPEKKLGKQRSVFPGRWGTKKVASRKLGSKASGVPSQSPNGASVSAAASVGRWATSHRDVAAPEGEPSLASPFGGRWCPVGTVQRLTEPAGESAPAGGGEGNPPPPRTCAILSMSTSGSELPLARIESPGTGPPGPKMGK